MSRHLIPGLNPTHVVYVGWDRPLLTYFGQVYDPAKEEGETPIYESVNPIYWIGADRPRQLPEVRDLVDGMAKYAELAPAMIRTLYDDKELRR